MQSHGSDRDATPAAGGQGPVSLAQGAAGLCAVVSVLATWSTVWPVAEVLMLAALGLAGLAAWRGWWRIGGAPAGLFVATLVAIAGLTVVASRAALLEVAQLVLVLVVGAVGYSLAVSRWRRPVLAALALGWSISVLWAVGQQVAGMAAVDVGAGLGSRALYGVCVAVALPPALAAVASLGRRRKGPGATGMLVKAGLAAMVVAGALSITYLPALVLYVGSALGACYCVRGQGGRRAILAGLGVGTMLIGTGLTPGPNLQALPAGVATRDAAGFTRRWLVEDHAALRAVADAPLRGHGPGSYQHTVGEPVYRDGLPETAENRVEARTQPGYLVLALEYGLLVPLLVALALVGLALGVLRRRSPADRAVGVALLAVALGMAATNLLVIGPGMLLAALVALAARRRGRAVLAGAVVQADGGATAASPRAPWWRSAWGQAGLAAALTAGCVAVGMRPKAVEAAASRMASAGGGASAGGLVVWEAEAGRFDDSTIAPLRDPGASGGGGLQVLERTRAEFLASSPVVYKVAVPAAGDYRLWLRTRWRDGCGNSLAVGQPGAPPAFVGNDGTYGVWHWVEGPLLHLPAGAATLHLMPRESGAEVDQLCLSADAAFFPQGILGLDVAAGDAADSSAADPNAIAAASPSQLRWEYPPAAVQKPFRVGIGGIFASGAEAHLVALGVPYRFLLEESEMVDPAKLAAYDVVWISGFPNHLGTAVWDALLAYVKGGGTALIEVGSGEGASRRELLAPYGRFTNLSHYVGVTVQPDDSPYFGGSTTPLALTHPLSYCAYLAAPASGQESSDVEAHGQVVTGRLPPSPAFTKKTLGKGTVFVFGAPPAFFSVRDETAFLPFGRAVLRAAIAGRYAPLFDDLAWLEPAHSGPEFHDDFMRVQADEQTWTAEAGSFRLTGDTEGPDPRFVMQLTAGARVAAGYPAWQGYRVAASLSPQPDSAAGLWLTTSRKRRLALILDRAADPAAPGSALGAAAPAASRLTLCEVDAAGAVRVLQSADVTAPGAWRRLSLFAADGQWQGWIDGRRVLQISATDGETAAGRFGALASRGAAYVDDLSVRAVGDLLPGTDRCPGEEGSSRALSPFQHGLEQRSVYSPHWLLQAAADRPHSIVPALPIYGPANLIIDGVDRGRLPTTPTESAISIPADEWPTSHVEILSPLWEDYTFGTQSTEWYDTGTPWERRERWSCERKWTYLGSHSDTPTIFWYRRPLTPPYAFRFTVAPAMLDANWRNRERPADLNLIIGGNGRDLQGALTLRTAAEGQGGCSLWRGETLLAREPDIGLPTGDQSLHHRWFTFTVQVDPDAVTFLQDGRPVFSVKTPEPIPAGQIAFWTERNAVSIARATISRSTP